jgi:hypothetical protein
LLSRAAPLVLLPGLGMGELELCDHFDFSAKARGGSSFSLCFEPFLLLVIVFYL